jgi:SlyX protein
MGRELLAKRFNVFAVAPLRHTKVYTIFNGVSIGLSQVASKFVSNQAMEPLKHIDQRLTDLEIKASFSEDLLDQLNLVIVKQQQQIDMLVREVMNLKQQPSAVHSTEPRNLRDDLPPHF